MSPIQTGWAEIPTRTKIIAPRSSSDLGRSAERIPSGSAINSQMIAPPITSDAVTGAARATMSLTFWRVAKDVPSDGDAKRMFQTSPLSRFHCTPTRRPRNLPYWYQTGLSVPMKWAARSMSIGSGALRLHSPAHCLLLEAHGAEVGPSVDRLIHVAARIHASREEARERAVVDVRV